MGLDMYLNIRKLSNDEAEPINIGYWRKANAVHRFLVGEEAYQSGEDNCKEFVIPAGKMKRLSAHCWRVLVFLRKKSKTQITLTS